MKQRIKELLFGRPASGIPLSSIKGTVRTCMPDIIVPQSEWHIVLYNALREVKQKLKD